MISLTRVRSRWCHGAPGVLILLSTVVRRFADESDADTDTLVLPEDLLDAIHKAMTRGGGLVYSRGFLRKGVGICHGVAGSVFALLSISEVLDSFDADDNEGKLWRNRAVHLAHLAVSYHDLEVNGEMSVPDRPYSLYEGVAGMCCAWADVLKVLNGETGLGIPGYDDLRELI